MSSETEFVAQAIPSGAAIWAWLLENSPELVQAIQLGVEANSPREVWTAVKIAGDILIDLFDPQSQPAGIKAMAVSIPWDQVVSALLPVLIEIIRRRRAEKGK